MRCPRLVLLTLALVCTIQPLLATETPTDCRYVHVVDPCQNDLLVFDRGEAFKRHNIPLSSGFAGTFDPHGVDFATVPGYRAEFSFVTQGPFLRVIDHHLAQPWRTIDVEIDLDVPGLVMTKIEAGPAVDVDGDPVYPLYVTGRTVLPGATHPIVLVFDQEALLANPLNLSSVLLATLPLCLNGVECLGTGLDVAVGQGPDGVRLRAYVSVMDIPEGIRRHRFYRVDWNADGTFDVALDPWNDEGVTFSGLAHRSIGLDYDGSGENPFGLFQSLGVVTDLEDGSATCPVIGDATDIEVWGSSLNGSSGRVHFVTSLAAGGDVLLGYRERECPDDGIEIPLGDYPRALAIESDDEQSLWVYTANKNHGVSAVQVAIGGGSLTHLQTIDIPFAGCPSDVAFRDPDVLSCSLFSFQPDPSQPGGPPADNPCTPDSTDPACICDEGKCKIRTPGPRR
jgi:hypothetical protein